MIARNALAKLGFIRRLHIHHLLTLAGIGDRFILGHYEAIAFMRYKQKLGLWIVNEGRQDILIILHINEDTDRFAMAAPARKRVRTNGEELATCREEQQLVSCLSMESQLELIAFLECQRREISHMALHRAQPALFRHNNCNRLTLDHRLMNVFEIMAWRVGKGAAALAKFGFRAKLLTDSFDFRADLLPLARARSKQAFQIGLFSSKTIEFFANLKFFKLAQGTQSHVEDCFGLIIRQIKEPHQLLFRFILFTNDADDFIKIEIGLQETAKDFQPLFDFCQTVFGTANQHFLAMFKPFFEHAAQ